MSSVKSNQKAESLRTKGCQALKNGELYEALLKFNKSLCNAEWKSRTIAQIYADRAEVFYRLKLYEKSLNNIELSRDELKVTENDEKLLELEENCLSHINDPPENCEDPWEFFKLSYPSRKRLPNVAECLELRNDIKFGRHIITTRPLKVGEIIAIEEPFFKILKADPKDDEYPESNIFQYCANCLNDNLMDLIPCPECTTTMFCSPNCRRTANKTFHQYECKILPTLNETGNWRMALRCFFDALAICDNSIEYLEDLMKLSDDVSPTVFMFDFSNPKNPESAKRKLMCLLSLARNVAVNKHDFSHIFQQHPLLRDIWTTHREFINRILERLMQIEILNFHGIKGRSLKKSNPYRSSLGDGGYPFCSLVNHSCCPNVMRIVVNNRMVMVVERPIKRGEQIFDCYIGDSFYFKPKTERREELLDYQFLCECDACVQDFPEVMKGNLDPSDKGLMTIVKKAYDDLRDPRKALTPDAAKALAVKYSAMLQKHYDERKYPCKEIVLLQLCIIKCFLVACKSTLSFP